MSKNVLKMVNFTPEASQMLSANISPVLVTDWALISSTDLTLSSLGSVSSVFSFTNKKVPNNDTLRLKSTRPPSTEN